LSTTSSAAPYDAAQAMGQEPVNYSPLKFALLYRPKKNRPKERFITLDHEA